MIKCARQWVNVTMDITLLMFLTRRIQQPHAGGRDPVNHRQIYQITWHRVSENSLLWNSRNVSVFRFSNLRINLVLRSKPSYSNRLPFKNFSSVNIFPWPSSRAVICMSGKFMSENCSPAWEVPNFFSEISLVFIIVENKFWLL